MSKSTPKKQAARKPEPMDASATEVKVGAPHVNHPRVCHAAKTLVAEVLDLFPETPVEYSNYNGRNTALDVTFDLTTLDERDADDLTIVLRLLDSDQRVAEVIAEESAVLVSFRNSPLLQDSRAPFNIAEAMSILDDPVDYMGGSL